MRRHSVIEQDYREKSIALNQKIMRLQREIREAKESRSLSDYDLNGLERSLSNAIKQLTTLRTNFRTGIFSPRLKIIF